MAIEVVDLPKKVIVHSYVSLPHIIIIWIQMISSISWDQDMLQPWWYTVTLQNQPQKRPKTSQLIWFHQPVRHPKNKPLNSSTEAKTNHNSGLGWLHTLSILIFGE